MQKLNEINLGVRLRRQRKNKDLTQKQLADMFGVHVNTISNWEIGGIIPDSKMHQVLQFVNESVTMPGAPVVAARETKADTRPRIPTEVAAGRTGGFSDSVTLSQCQRMPVIQRFPPYDYTIIVKGNSMEPKFEGGDEIAIKKVTSFIEWGKTYVLDTDDGAVVKRIFDDGDCFRCVSYNSEYPDFLIHKTTVYGVYKVVGLIRV